MNIGGHKWTKWTGMDEIDTFAAGWVCLAIWRHIAQQGVIVHLGSRRTILV